ncbi:MAG: hypothetical protein KDA60_22350, partial [Planctomycetales bacterium]|nr:hypothetical protein [Planctomycetales bacterium]
MLEFLTKYGPIRKLSRRTSRRRLDMELLEVRELLAGDVIMFNDTVAGPATHANVTTYAANGTASGPLLDVNTGVETGINLEVTQA